MKQLSYWAKLHPKTARVSIILLHIPLNIAGIVTGLLLFDLNVSMGQAFIYSLITITLLLFLFERKKTPYYTRKFLHLTMAVCTYLLFVFAGNQVHQPKPYFPFSQSVNAVGTSLLSTTISKPLQAKEKKPQKKLSRKESKNLFLKVDEKVNNLPLWAKIVLIFLAVVVAAGLLYVLAALACTISCNGSEALAVIVALVGTFGIVFGAIRLIQAILGKKRKKKRSTSTTD